MEDSHVETPFDGEYVESLPNTTSRAGTTEPGSPASKSGTVALKAMPLRPLFRGPIKALKYLRRVLLHLKLANDLIELLREVHAIYMRCLVIQAALGCISALRWVLRPLILLRLPARCSLILKNRDQRSVLNSLQVMYPRLRSNQKSSAHLLLERRPPPMLPEVLSRKRWREPCYEVLWVCRMLSSRMLRYRSCVHFRWVSSNGAELPIMASAHYVFFPLCSHEVMDWCKTREPRATQYHPLTDTTP